MSERVVHFTDLNDGAKYWISGDLVQGFSVVEIPATTEDGIALVGQKPKFKLQLWVEQRWWKLGTFDTPEEAQELGLHIMGTPAEDVSS